MSEAIKVNAGNSPSTIRRDIYGHFAEHLGRCIYGGFWVGKDSPIANIEGYRKDVVEAFKKIKIPPFSNKIRINNVKFFFLR